MVPVKVFVPYGAVGLGCSEEAFKRGLAMNPDIICSDAGSTDSGPYYLGTGKGKYARLAVRRDLKQMIEGAHALGVPTEGSTEERDMHGGQQYVTLLDLEVESHTDISESEKSQPLMV